jgi:hypothetical protein
VDCYECDRLRAEYDRLRAIHETSLTELRSISEPSGNIRKFQRARLKAEEARIDTDIAQLSLERHLRRHQHDPRGDE